MNKILWIIMAFAAGAFLPIQAGLNAKLGKAAGVLGLTAMGAGLIMSLFPGKKVEDLTPERNRNFKQKSRRRFY